MITKSHTGFRLVLALALALGTVTFLGGGTAQAADNGRWSAFPVKSKDNKITPRQYFIINSTPGQTIKDSATLSNNTTEPLVLDVYGSDAYNTPTGGGYALRPDDEEQTGVGSWITVGKTKVTVPPAKEVKEKGKTVLKPGTVSVPVTIKIPEGAAPGDHAGGVVTRDAGTIPAPGETGVNIRQANAIRVYVRVAGPVTPQLIVSDVSLGSIEPRKFPLVGDAGSGLVTYKLVNSGNVRVTPNAVLRLRGLLGQTITTVRLPSNEVLPGQTVELQQTVAKMPALDRVEARIDLDAKAYPEVKAAGSATAWSVSWIFLGTLLVLVIAGGAYAFTRRRRTPDEAPVGRRRATAGAGGAPVA